MAFENWLMFLAVAFVAIISPGPAILLAISNGVTQGLRIVSIAALGNVAGLFVLSTVSIFGLSVVLQASSWLFLLIKFFGAAYLIYLGVKKLLSKQSTLDHTAYAHQNRQRGLKSFYEGFAIAITNPKAILFFVALFPIFLDTSAAVAPQFFIMTFTFMCLSFISLLTFGGLANTVRHWFKNSKAVKTFNRVTGGIFIAMGLLLLQFKRETN